MKSNFEAPTGSGALAIMRSASRQHVLFGAPWGNVDLNNIVSAPKSGAPARLGGVLRAAQDRLRFQRSIFFLMEIYD